MLNNATTESRKGSVVALFTATFVLSTIGWLALITVSVLPLGWEPRVVSSGSMEPLIRPGAVIAVDPGVPADLKPGKVVTFNDPDVPGSVVTHRLIAQNEDGTWITKGDANAIDDPAPIPASAIIGEPRLLVPMAGMVPYWNSNGQAYKTAVLGLGLFASIIWLVNPRGAVRKPIGKHARPETDDQAREQISVATILRDVTQRGNHAAPPAKAPIVASGVTAIAIGLLTVGGVVMPATDAAFTARDVNGLNSWEAATSPSPSPSP